MSAYKNDPRVQTDNGAYHVTAPDRQWSVCEVGGQWDAWPFPECTDPAFDDQKYFAEHLSGAGALRADEKIRELIGEPRA